MNQESDSPAGLTLCEFTMYVFDRYREHVQTRSHDEARDLAYAQALQDKLGSHRGNIHRIALGNREAGDPVATAERRRSMRPTTEAVREALSKYAGDLEDLVRYLQQPRTEAQLRVTLTAAFALGFEEARGYGLDAGKSGIPQRTPQEQVQQFNHLFPIGTRVRYWTGAREGTGRISVTRSEASVLSGRMAVIFIEGVAGCVDLSHVEPI